MICESVAISFLIATAHLQREVDYPFNGFTPGVVAECSGWIGGAYRNSYEKPTFFGGYHLHNDYVGVFAALATGYNGQEKPLIAGFTARYDRFFILFGPKFRGNQNASYLTIGYTIN